jgi:prefoldin subunit 5
VRTRKQKCVVHWLTILLIHLRPSSIQLEQNYSVKIPDIEKSLALVKTLQKKQDEGENAVTRYNLCDSVYGKAEIDTSVGIVNLWLGANVMLEYTYQEAIDFLQQNLTNAQTESKLVQEDLAFVRDQIVTSEVSMSRIFNWDVRRKRAAAAVNDAKPPADATAASTASS